MPVLTGDLTSLGVGEHSTARHTYKREKEGHFKDIKKKKKLKKIKPNLRQNIEDLIMRRWATASRIAEAEAD